VPGLRDAQPTFEHFVAEEIAQRPGKDQPLFLSVGMLDGVDHLDVIALLGAVKRGNSLEDAITRDSQRS
jgi:hypothetical protein